MRKPALAPPTKMAVADVIKAISDVPTGGARDGALSTCKNAPVT